MLPVLFELPVLDPRTVICLFYSASSSFDQLLTGTVFTEDSIKLYCKEIGSMDM